jgi:hypothetical protein
MKIMGKPGEWYVEDEEGGLVKGPVKTRQELRQLLATPESEEQEEVEEEDIIMRLLIERGENGRIKEVKVLKG